MSDQVRRLRFVCTGHQTHREQILAEVVYDPADLMPIYLAQPPQVGDRWREIRAAFLNHGRLPVSCTRCRPRPAMPRQVIDEALQRMDPGATLLVDVSRGATLG